MIYGVGGLLALACVILFFFYYTKKRAQEEETRKKFEEEIERREKEEQAVKAQTIARKEELSKEKIMNSNPQETRNMIFKKSAMQKSILSAQLPPPYPSDNWQLSTESVPLPKKKPKSAYISL